MYYFPPSYLGSYLLLSEKIASLKCYLVGKITPTSTVLDLILGAVSRNTMEKTLRSEQSREPLPALGCQRFSTGLLRFMCQGVDAEIDTNSSSLRFFMLFCAPLSGLKIDREPNLQRTKNAR